MRKFLVVISCLLFCLKAEAVIISEVAWMGTTEQWQNEWIELYNPDKNPTNLEGWIIKTDELIINLKGIIKPNSYFLLERTDDTTVPDINADQIYKGSLKNSGEKLTLLNKKGIVEEIDCSLGWFAGENETKRTMERINYSDESNNPKNWQTSSKENGTPQAENSEKKIFEKKEIKTTSSEKNPEFVFFLSFSSVFSLFFSLFWLKIMKKQSSI